MDENQIPRSHVLFVFPVFCCCAFIRVNLLVESAVFFFVFLSEAHKTERVLI